jgi:hypothetical protein
MTKTHAIRDALAGGPLAFRQLHLKIGGDDKKLNDLCCYLRTRGELKIGGDEDHTITLLKSGGGTRSSRKGKKPAGKRIVKRPYKRLADKTAARNGADLRALALDNYVGAGALLRQAIEDGVEDLENALGLRAALANHDRAERLLAAAREPDHGARGRSGN